MYVYNVVYIHNAVYMCNAVHVFVVICVGIFAMNNL